VKIFDGDKARMIGLPCVEETVTIGPMLSRIRRIPYRDGQTDGRTEFLYQYRASVC